MRAPRRVSAACFGGRAVSDRLRKAPPSAPSREWVCQHAWVSPTVPVWPSREAWIEAVRAWTQSAAFAALRAPIAAATLIAIATVWATCADHPTGRHAAATRAWIGARVGCDVKTVSRAWAALKAGGWAIKVQEGHGSNTTPSVGRRPSIWHLTVHHPAQPAPTTNAPPTPHRCAPAAGPNDRNSAAAVVGDGSTAPGPRPSVSHSITRQPQAPAATPAQAPAAPIQPTPATEPAVENVHLPAKPEVVFKPPVTNHSPSTRAYARAPEHNASASTRPGRRWRSAPRPLTLQRLAAKLIAQTHGLGPRPWWTQANTGRHVGAICDALTAAGIDPNIWTATQIVDRLNADMQTTRWTWPDRIERPAAFLASRLRRLDWRPQRPPQSGGSAAGQEQKKGAAMTAKADPPAQPVVPTPEQRKWRRAQLDAVRVEIRQRRATGTPLVLPVAAPVCVVCKADTAQRRRYRGLLGPHMCGPCWDVVVSAAAAPNGQSAAVAG